jgi:PDZ domain-containing secreted protein
LKFTKKYFALIALALFILLGFLIQIDYYIIMPSRAVNLGEIIEIDNADRDDQGSFYLVTVSQKRASLITAAYGYLASLHGYKPYR